MTIKRGEIWLADLNPTRGSEQAGTRPVLVFQNDVVSKFTTTILAIPLTTNLRRASLPSCVRISKSEATVSRSLTTCWLGVVGTMTCVFPAPKGCRLSCRSASISLMGSRAGFACPSKSRTTARIRPLGASNGDILPAYPFLRISRSATGNRAARRRRSRNVCKTEHIRGRLRLKNSFCTAATTSTDERSSQWRSCFDAHREIEPRHKGPPVTGVGSRPTK